MKALLKNLAIALGIFVCGMSSHTPMQKLPSWVVGYSKQPTTSCRIVQHNWRKR